MKSKLFALLCLVVLPCQATNITLFPGPSATDRAHGNRSFVKGSTNAIIDEDIDPINTLPAAGSTSATSKQASSFSLYTGTDSGFSASWTGTLQDGVITGAQTFLRFQPTVDLQYELEGSYVGFVVGSRLESFTLLEGVTPQERVSPHIYETMEHDSGPFHYSFSFSGILSAGELVQFSHDILIISAIRNDPGQVASGTGAWTLKLSAVPEAGSTLAMLGMALTTVLGLKPRRRA